MPDFSDPNFDFDEAQRALDRKRKQIASLLAQPVVGGDYRGKHYVPPYEQLHKAIINAAGSYEQKGLDAQGAELASAKNEAIAKLLSEPPEDTPASPGSPGVVGTGPLAPPPGTPGVEQPGVLAPEINSPEMMGAGPQPATPTPPDTPALWMGKNTMDMVPRGLTGENFLPNQAPVPATPLIPAPLSKVTEWAGKFDRFGNISDTTKEAIKFRVQQPERAQLAREAAAARAVVEQHRYEDKLADNARQQKELEAKVESGKLTAAETARHHKESERLQAEAMQLRRDLTDATNNAKREAAASKQSDHEKTVVKHTKEYGLQLNKEKIPQLDMLLTGVEKGLEGFKNPDGTYQNIPGLGLGGNLRSDAGLDPKALDLRRAIVPLRRLITTSEAGLSQTASEMKGVLDQLGITPWSTDESFIKAIPHIRAVLESRKNTISSAFEPEAVDTFHGRAKTTNPQGKPPVRVKSEAEYKALPSGTVFIPEDGSAPRTKP